MKNIPALASNMGLKAFGNSGSGRSVMANNQLHQILAGFQEMSQIPSSQGYHALAIINAINHLRGGAVPVNSFLKDGSATRRCIVGAGFEIEYETNNYYGGPQTDVVILDIRITKNFAEEGSRAAMWEAEWQRDEHGNKHKGSWLPSDKPITFLNSRRKVTGKKDDPLKIGINGYSKNLEHAITILPSHISRGDNVALEKLKHKGYTLFYVPQSDNLKSGWRCVKNLGQAATMEDMEAARILASHMKEAHDKGLYVEWTSHRGGSKVLTKAMEQLALRQINVNGKQKIFLSDPTSSHYAADNLRRKIGINTNDLSWLNSTPGLAQLTGGSHLGTSDLTMSINVFFNYTAKEEKVDKIIDSLRHGVKFGEKSKKALTIVGGATLLSSMGVSFTTAQAFLGVLGWKTVKGAAAITLASIPSLNEGYHKDSAEPTKQLLRKLLSK
ncbi:hypothetical protein ACJJIK_00145 [Microbulbifer sp. ZKSA006]|uniref:hypothetical protein n=1 Tax=Microbulbifer sp. ZKSA006 TaxID=3243390 RepID=UPI0040392FCD